jgi:hypothetical protein
MWDVRALFTLTDKDWLEINASQGVYPDAKHQLCFWHCLQAIKMQLAILRRASAFYDVAEAWNKFSSIDETFVPVGQCPNSSPVCLIFFLGISLAF